ncbi:I78 family peptidase inhibitor [Streptomyces sp. CA-294286]|uniref:I78 family peptidase inhibitor n=1 Tax=Streptomyces sp. CA-294286 TaxID=3240070 RepID=UPI003D8CFA0D
MHSTHLKTLFTAAAMAATFLAPAAESHAAESGLPTVAAAPDYQQWVGRTLVRNGKQPPASMPVDRLVHERDLPEPHRVITPGSFTTMDYVEDRVNVHVDEHDTITHVDFG